MVGQFGEEKRGHFTRNIQEKERNGEEITDQEYDKIHYIGSVVEHYFLIFKSLGNAEYALSNPDPIGKIYDVAGTDGLYLMAAVGNAMEWDHVVPYFGRHQIVKGAVYSYYEFQSIQLLNDKEWNEKIKTENNPSWIRPFLVQSKLDSHPETGY